MKSLDTEKLKLIKIRIIYKEFQFQKDIRTALLPDTLQDVIVTVP